MKLESVKAQFLTEYKRLCEKYNMIVIYKESANEGEESYFSAYAMSVKKDPSAISEQCTEILLNNTLRYTGKFNEREEDT